MLRSYSTRTDSSGKEKAETERQIWLSDMDSNHDKGLQRALCYHYTIGQTGGKVPAGFVGVKQSLSSHVRAGATNQGGAVLPRRFDFSREIEADRQVALLKPSKTR